MQFDHFEQLERVHVIEEEERDILVRFRNASEFIRPSYSLSKSRHFV